MQLVFFIQMYLATRFIRLVSWFSYMPVYVLFDPARSIWPPWLVSKVYFDQIYPMAPYGLKQLLRPPGLHLQIGRLTYIHTAPWPKITKPLF